MIIIGIKRTFIALLLASVSYTASAEWVLNNAESTLNFISIKKLTVGEVHTFKNLEGSLKDNGEVTVDVSLSSVDTKIPTRDDRMKKVFFEVVKFPKATVSTKVDVKRINSLKAGESFSQNLPLELSIHGQQNNIDAELRITALADNKILATTVKPIIIKMGDYKLEKGIELLKALAKLSSISTAVPVTVNFIFEK
ncbi:MAG: YceI family protein [Methylococcaceae bacterium]|nr:YceI family protein [Methylococcaceae bacterium]